MIVATVATVTGCNSKSSGDSGTRTEVVAAGAKAPALSLTLQDGSKVTLSSLKGHNVLLWFYPKDDTPG